MPSELTREMSERMMVLIAERDFEGFMDYCDEQSFDFDEVVMMLAGVCKTMMPKVSSDLGPDEMWAMETDGPGAAAGPPPAFQLFVAYANDDMDMVSAHLSAIMQTPESLAAALGDLLRVAADFMELWLKQQRESS